MGTSRRARSSAMSPAPSVLKKEEEALITLMKERALVRCKTAQHVLRVREGANVERRVGVPRASASDERVPERTHERCDAGDDEGAMDRGWEAVDRGSGEDTQVFRLTTPASGGSRRAAAERRRETHRATTIGRSEC